jgi:hypothetical protein
MKNALFLAIAAMFISASASAQTTVDSIRAKYPLKPMPAPLTIEKTFPVLGGYQLVTSPDQATTTNAASTSTTSTSNTSATTTMSVDGQTDTAAQADVTITLDSVSRGMIWVEGLPQGKFKAYLKKSPATYRILAQKTNLGKQIPEGTLIFNPETNTLNVVLGKEFNDEDPAGIFATTTSTSTSTEADVKVKTTKSKTKTKAKPKLTFYTANKVVAADTAQGTSNGTTDQQQQ